MKTYIKNEIENLLKNAMQLQSITATPPPKPILTDNQKRELAYNKTLIINKLSLERYNKNLKRRLTEKDFINNFTPGNLKALKEVRQLSNKKYISNKRNYLKIKSILNTLKPFSLWELRIIYLNSLADN